ncbi:arylamine N-acetyltransferase [Streptomyces sp. 3MP-14]|uniref:Arylamine N-acetyltransferase n=1 Tax=Streptomyces mimosae TaxID=2586635 RepID=A0A5N6AHM1_9ACTN|nr:MULTISPECIES: arylamine N-acetyltransferase [Streptomyces]KAB8167755.1 arylamine N-acetyltransferase [Streptomyces mimosae]KAB8177597.1 arylamine N-acetyltransferase [Streptomyces sp. 3MP-14]
MSTASTPTSPPAPAAETTTPFDLDAYLARIGWRGAARADVATLRGVHAAHLRAIPFENLDALGGTAPSLEPAALVRKLLHERRGGYCYEQNTLLAMALERLGFAVTLLVGRVVVGADSLTRRPRTHAVLLVRVPGDPRPYLADVGYGDVAGLLEAVPLRADVEFRVGPRRHRLVTVEHEGPLELWVLRAWSGGGWVDQYAFTVEPFVPADLEVMNWHVATNPRSPFSWRLTVRRTTGTGHLALDERRLTETRDDGRVFTRELAGEEDVRAVLEREFAIAAPATTRLVR